MSNDLISRQAAIDAIFSEPLYKSGMKKREADEVVPAIYEKIKVLPTAQPEIIRCKDCKYGVNFYRDGECYCSNPKYELRYFGGSWEFYCADAERRET